ncbi:MAG: hypothetical protein K8W52_41940 [Deltaproteobacteria bacterium]|nr:hypothetical protein [Deltaproteobacteria bacterium]
MHRRTVLRFGLASALLALARPADARRAHPLAPQVFAGISHGGAKVAGALVTLRPDGGREFVTTDGNLHARAFHVFAIDNASTRFLIWAQIDAPAPSRWVYLLDGQALRMASSTGSDDTTGATATFEVDAATAKRFARIAHVPVRRRTPLDGGLIATWANPGGAARDQPIRIAITVENTAASPVRFAIGGRNRGPRDNRFVFRARKDGHEVTPLDAPDFGGLMQHQRLATGERVTVEADLRAWFTAPGVYDLDCSYEGELIPDTPDAGAWPGHAHETWDYSARGSLRVIVP